MTKTKQLFYWGHKQKEAFEKLKDKFALALILVSFDPEMKIILKTNASNQALGSCVSQPDTER